ncbi:PucR family transcriptional regulator [Smaragdicoccus niigatensis]|uniref:PucR family transcriptional regulator n=1 Tax=Smaragdicoccus niigatensis TaxID=359359 RepID=UPI000374D0A4|nr:helix-turn-helix domain-containing protein [Smaragdicoccus niigatensis]
MADGQSERDAVITDMVGQIIGRLTERLPEIARRTQQILVNELQELREDSQILALMADTVTANIETVFAALRNRIPMTQIEPPTVAVEYARRLAQRDVHANVMMRAYRIGHQTVLKLMLGELRQVDLDVTTAIDVTDRITTESFEYIDSISQRVMTTYYDERVRWQESRNYDRASHVRELLKGGDADLDAMTTLVQYPFRRKHLAIVVWIGESPDGSETATLERFIHRVAKAVSPQDSCLYVPADRLTAWGWIPLPQDQDSTTISARVADVLASTEHPPFIAIGRAIPGIEGFRRSHAQAVDARRVALSDVNRTNRMIEAREPGVLLAGLLADNLDDTRGWVCEVLGPLASATENDERLRDTLRAFLSAGSSFKAAATDLHLHFNTVRYRVDRAVERRGRPIDEDRIDVELALGLCHLLGPAVLAG